MDSADFTANELTITDLTKGSGVDAPFTMSFTDAAFNGLILSKTSDSFTGGVASSLSGSVVTVSWAGASIVPGKTLMATFNLSGATTATPEPSSWGMLGLSAVIGALAFLRQRAGAGFSTTRP